MQHWRRSAVARGRPPLPVGTWGEVWTERYGAGWRARTRFRDYDGRTRLVTRSGRTKGAARNTLTAYLLERTTPVDGGEISNTTKVSALCEAYYSRKLTQGKWADNTRRRYREVIDSYVTPRIGELRMEEVTVGRLDTFLQGVSSEIGAPTARLCKTVLSGALGLAVRHGALTANLMRETESIEVATKAVATLEFAQIAKLRAIAAEKDANALRYKKHSHPATAVIVDTLLGTGARIGEVLAVRLLEDLDLTARKVRISGTVVPDSKTGTMIRQGHTKGGKDRELLLPQFTVDALTHYAPSVPPNTDGLLFPSAVGTVRNPNNFRKIWRAMVEEAGLPKGTSPHTIRKTVATAVDELTDLRTAASQLGNDEAVARKHYIKDHLEAPDVTEVLQGLVTPDLKVVAKSS